MRSSNPTPAERRPGPRGSRLVLLCGTTVMLASALVPLYGHGELEIRIAAVSRQIATNGTNARLFLERADLHRLHQDWPAATADLDRAALLSPDLATVSLARGRLLADSGRIGEAREAFDAYLNRAPTDGVALIERARIRAQQNECSGALADYTKAISLLPEPLPEHFIERADLAMQCGERNEAIQGLDEGLKRLGVIVTLQAKAIELELARKNFDGALRRLETIIARANRRELWLERKGLILRQAGRNEEAALAFQESLQAVAKLPARLQTTPNMERLKARVELAVKELNAVRANTNR